MALLPYVSYHYIRNHYINISLLYAHNYINMSYILMLIKYLFVCEQIVVGANLSMQYVRFIQLSNKPGLYFAKTITKFELRICIDK